MRRIIWILVFSVFAIPGYTYDWILYSPPGIVIQHVHFFEMEAGSAVFAYDHFYYSETIIDPVWQHIDIPADGAASFNSDTILIIISEGSYSDGVYFMDLTSHQYSVLEYCFRPNFILKEQGVNHYFVGFEDGLLESNDGRIWNEVKQFTGVECLDMAGGSQDVFALACNYDENNVYMSYDDGITWEQKIFPAQFFEIAYSGGGSSSKPVGICNGKLGGLYRLEEDNWEILYYSLTIQALGHSNGSIPYVGWYTGMPPDIGIAAFNIYNPHASIYYVNEGLPNTNIFSIAEISLAIVGAQWVCCCTDEGAFFSYGIDVGQDELSHYTGGIELYPNPIAGKLHISALLEDNCELNLTLMDMAGRLVLSERIDSDTKTIEVNGLLSGVYIASIQSNSGTILHSEKIIKL